jgi:uncharacterized protein
MIDPQLLAFLVCPETRTPLHVAEAGLIAHVNELAAQGRLENRRGQVLENPIDGGLVRADGRLLFPIVDGIPLMLIDEAIPLDDVRISHV